MFEKAYRKEMNDLHVSESLIADTVKMMQDEQSKLQEQSVDTFNAADKSEEPANSKHATPKARSSKARRLLFMKVVLPAAACLTIAFVGVTLFFQLADTSNQDSQYNYAFQEVEGNVSLIGGLLLGSSDQPQNDIASGLRRADLTEEFLPKDILSAKPTSFKSYSVYLGFDKQRTVYYAVYQESDSSESWVILQSVNLDEAGFIKALESYFS